MVTEGQTMSFNINMSGLDLQDFFDLYYFISASLRAVEEDWPWSVAQIKMGGSKWSLSLSFSIFTRTNGKV